METDKVNRFNMNRIVPRGAERRRFVRLKTGSDIQRLLGKTMNEALRGELDIETARTVGYLSSVMIKCIEVSDIQRRLEVLEKATEKGEKSK